MSRRRRKPKGAKPTPPQLAAQLDAMDAVRKPTLPRPRILPDRKRHVKRARVHCAILNADIDAL